MALLLEPSVILSCLNIFITFLYFTPMPFPFFLPAPPAPKNNIFPLSSQKRYYKFQKNKRHSKKQKMCLVFKKKCDNPLKFLFCKWWFVRKFQPFLVLTWYLPWTINSARRSLVPINGGYPHNSINSRMPQPHTSTGFPYGWRFTTSGAMNCGVPIRPKQINSKLILVISFKTRPPQADANAHLFNTYNI